MGEDDEERCMLGSSWSVQGLEAYMEQYEECTRAGSCEGKPSYLQNAEGG